MVMSVAQHLHLSVELPEMSECCVSIENVTDAFPLPVLCFTGQSLEQICLFLHLHLKSQIWMWLVSFFLPQLHHCMLVSPYCLGFLFPPCFTVTRYAASAGFEFLHHTKYGVCVIQSYLRLPCTMYFGHVG